jgi:hypothetical protein
VSSPRYDAQRAADAKAKADLKRQAREPLEGRILGQWRAGAETAAEIARALGCGAQVVMDVMDKHGLRAKKARAA